MSVYFQGASISQFGLRGMFFGRIGNIKKKIGPCEVTMPFHGIMGFGPIAGMFNPS
jgi:hypothetical protein